MSGRAASSVIRGRSRRPVAQTTHRSRSSPQSRIDRAGNRTPMHYDVLQYLPTARRGNSWTTRGIGKSRRWQESDWSSGRSTLLAFGKHSRVYRNLLTPRTESLFSLFGRSGICSL
ncbi:hypothetical protein BDV95DRAFT_82716 [Massariosphaeria phaeospora]|uniref:Uncharacterized protein n=1 Tax=Massariosphaeria phaeospora TaxID=100035 RepID=A0A7C8I819_9PLEO|nr:hypothetical protein BDV95DRAFT_82716 [Massariosphaeria phaeospora]